MVCSPFSRHWLVAIYLGQQVQVANAAQPHGRAPLQLGPVRERRLVRDRGQRGLVDAAGWQRAQSDATLGLKESDM